MRHYDRVFSELYVTMVATHEAGGILDTILLRLASSYLLLIGRIRGRMKLRTGSGCWAVAVAAVLSACSHGGVPGTADVPDIIAEAAGTKPEPRRDSEARRAVRASFRAMLLVDSIHVAEVAGRFQRHELSDSYLLRDVSFVGGTWPKQTAVLLREVQRADFEYLAAMQSFRMVLERRLAETDLSDDQRRVLTAEMATAFATRQQPVVQAVEAFDQLIGGVAEVYELAANHPSSIKAMRTGLEIEDERVLQRYNSMVDRVNNLHAVADSAVRRLEPQQQARFARMRVVKPIKRT